MNYLKLSHHVISGWCLTVKELNFLLDNQPDETALVHLNGNSPQNRNQFSAFFALSKKINWIERTQERFGSFFLSHAAINHTKKRVSEHWFCLNVLKKLNRNRFEINLATESTCPISIHRETCQLVNVCHVNCIAHVCRTHRLLHPSSTLSPKPTGFRIPFTRKYLIGEDGIHSGYMCVVSRSFARQQIYG